MTKFDTQHAENDLIDKAVLLLESGQASGSGGRIAQKFGSLIRLSGVQHHAALGAELALERVSRSDDPEADAVKGSRTQTQIPNENGC